MGLENKNSYLRYLAAQGITSEIHCNPISIIDNKIILFKKEKRLDKEENLQVILKNLGNPTLSEGALAAITRESKFEKLCRINNIIEKIRNDTDPLVRYCELERLKFRYLSEIFNSLFWDLPHEARLAAMRGDRKGYGKEVLAIVQAGIEKYNEKTLPYDELREVVEEFTEYNLKSDYWKNEDLMWEDFEFSITMSLSSLWQILTIQDGSPSKKFTENLPAIPFIYEPDSKLADQLEEYDLNILLSRKDIALKEFRKKLFFDPKKPLYLRGNATLYNFTLTYEEYDSFLKKLKSEKNIKKKREDGKILYYDDIKGNDLDLCILASIMDEMSEDKLNHNMWDSGYIRSIEEHITKKANSLTGEDQQIQITELRLYSFARRVYNRTDYPFEPELKFLESHIVLNDRWATFMAFSKIWQRNKTRSSELKLLEETDYLDVPIIMENEDINPTILLQKEILVFKESLQNVVLYTILTLTFSIFTFFVIGTHNYWWILLSGVVCFSVYRTWRKKEV